MRISRQSLRPPRRSRHNPRAAKAKGEDRPNARDLLASVNSASEGAAATWLAFLGTMAYLAVALGGVTHVDLLLNNDATLPFVGVKVPLATFFVAAPLAFVLVHFSLLLQHVMLSRKLRAFEERLQREELSRDRSTQNIRDELHSYTFTQSISGKPKGTAVDMALRLVTSLTLVVLPLLLLTFFQIGFLAYHSEPITWWHRSILLADVALIVVLARHLARRDRETKVKLTDWWRGTSTFKAKLIVWWRRRIHAGLMALSRLSLPAHGRHYGSAVAGVIRPVLRGVRGSGTVAMRSFSPNRIVMGVLVFFSICVATLPDTPWDPFDRWMASIRLLSEPVPYCRPTRRTAPDGKEFVEACPLFTSAARRAFYPTAFLFERKINETTGKSDSMLGWSRNLIVTDKDLVDDDKKEVRLSLRGRDLRYATLDRSDLKRADLFRAELGKARLVRTDLRGARLDSANLEGANLADARLQDADLREASLQGADLREARLQNTDLRGARLQGADVREANVRGADFRGASLQGADLRRVSLQGVVLRDAKLQGAAIGGADLQCIDLTVARLQGADFRGTNLQGANLDGVSLQGADLGGAKLWNTRPPGVHKMPAPNDERDLVSFAPLKIQPLDNDDRSALNDIVTQFDQLQEDRKKGNPGQALLAEILEKIRACFDSLIKSRDQSEWKTRDDLRAWCKLAQQPSPDPTRLAAYLGALACEDDLDNAYMAQRLISRVLRSEPDAFLEAFKGCPAFGRIPTDLKSQLEQAAQEDRKKAAKRKENPEKIDLPTPPKAPDICASL